MPSDPENVCKSENWLNALKTILGNLGYRKLCTNWVPQMKVLDHKEQRVQWSGVRPWVMISLTESLPEMKRGYTTTNRSRSGSVWSGDNNFLAKKLKAQPSAEKIMSSVFWEQREVFLVDIL
jgi:hypothetical protein